MKKQICKAFIDTVNNVKAEFIKKTANRHTNINLPWLTEHIWNLMKKRDHLLKKALKSGIDTDMRLFKDYRNKVVN